jgi:hypothetical protein
MTRGDKWGSDTGPAKLSEYELDASRADGAERNYGTSDLRTWRRSTVRLTKYIGTASLDLAAHWKDRSGMAFSPRE